MRHQGLIFDPMPFLTFPRGSTDWILIKGPDNSEMHILRFTVSHKYIDIHNKSMVQFDLLKKFNGSHDAFRSQNFRKKAKIEVLLIT